MSNLSHIDREGSARMVDVSAKPVTARVAVAEGSVRMSRAAFEIVTQGTLNKGDVLSIAQVAGMLAAKRTAELIPLCHPLALDQVTVEASLDESLPGVRIRAVAKAVARTGVEMEALTAASIACLTVYDMAKSADRAMEILDIRLVEKSGGKSGSWRRGS